MGRSAAVNTIDTRQVTVTLVTPRLRVRTERPGRYDDGVSRTIEDALVVAAEAHRGQSYPAREPEPFIMHPLRVMLGVAGEPARIVALLHDVVEDSPMTLRDLVARGFDQSTVDAVDCLSRRDAEPYDAYIRRVATNRLARDVKLCDLADNLANNRALPATPDNLARIARYEDALRVLRADSN
jgi:(p)ppGpp synthase/HD superfamily hydrolase